MPVWLWAYSVMMRGIRGTSWCMSWWASAVDGDREEAGIAEDDFVVAFGRGVAFKGGAHVLGQGARRLGSSRMKRTASSWPRSSQWVHSRSWRRHSWRMAQGDLPGQDLEKGHRFLAEIVTQVDLVHPFADEIAGVEEAAGPVNNVDHLLPGRDGFRTDVVEAVLPPAGAHQRLTMSGMSSRNSWVVLASTLQRSGCLTDSSMDLDSAKIAGGTDRPANIPIW